MIKIPYKHIMDTKNKKLIELCLLYLFNIFFYETNILIYNNYYITFKSFVPLPINFISDNFLDIKIDNDSIYLNTDVKNKNRTIIANRILPYFTENPIPFSFPVFCKGKYEIINSNIFYYEITISEQIKQSWNDETIVIGYGSVYTNKNSNPGWENNTFGYHLDDGTYQYNGNIINKFGPICKFGDIIGAGIIYISETIYQPFFTINGILLNKLIPEITIPHKIVPMLGIDYSHIIKYNFGIKEFKFNIKNHLHGRNIISLKNIFYEKLHQNNKFNLSKNEATKKNDIPSKINIAFLNNIISELTQHTTTITQIDEQNNFFVLI
jgi:hypothetical protein